MFEPDPHARADLKPGTTYAVAGENGWLYYGQVAPGKHLAFFRYRGKQLEPPGVALAHPLMSAVMVAYPSITRALRAGRWKKLGRLPFAPTSTSPLIVQWPVGTLTVTVWSSSGDEQLYDTRVDDPAIQDAELMAVWDAQQHIPKRLTADFGVEEAEWDVGGPIRRERRIREELARRFPDQPWHQLPDDWVPTNVA